MEPVAMTLFGFVLLIIALMPFIPDFMSVKDIKVYRQIWKDIDSYEPRHWFKEGARIYYAHTRHIGLWVSSKSDYQLFLDKATGDVAVFKDDKCFISTYVNNTVLVKRMKCYRGIVQELHKKKWEFLDNIDKQPTLVS